MTLHILYFAAARERVGVSRESLELPAGARVADVLRLLAERHPALAPLLPTCAWR